jgi:regulatory protein YycH of two-component signal transduction system YycFG
MKKETVLTVLLVILVLVSLVQAFQLMSLNERVKTGAVVASTSKPTAAASSSSKLPSSLQDLPQMVGGC